MVLGLAGSLAACGSSGGAGDAGPDASSDVAPPMDASDAAQPNDAASDAADGSAGGCVDTLDANRDPLLATYLAFLKAFATTPQSNGLSSSTVSSVCDVWSKLDPSA